MKRTICSQHQKPQATHPASDSINVTPALRQPPPTACVWHGVVEEGEGVMSFRFHCCGFMDRFKFK